MSKTLTIIRHAKSSWSGDGADYDRVLNERGRSDADLVGHYLHKQKVQFDALFCSSAARAVETLQRLNASLKISENKILVDDDLYLASLQKLVDYINSIDNRHNQVALIGHNPGLTELCQFLTEDSIQNLPTCTAYSISLPIDDWMAVGPRLGSKIMLLTPRMLKQT